MTEALNGRIQAFDRAFAADASELEEAVRRNVYGTVTPSEIQVGAMADYLRRVRATLAETSSGDLCAARLTLPEPAAAITREGTNATG
jgi:cytochrome b pre-mRNA-processing protein 3